MVPSNLGGRPFSAAALARTPIPSSLTARTVTGTSMPVTMAAASRSWALLFGPRPHLVLIIAPARGSGSVAGGSPPPFAQVPRVRQDRFKAATALLTSDAFNRQRGVPVHSHAVPRGKVSAPPGRSGCRRARRITLLVSSGR